MSGSLVSWRMVEANRPLVLIRDRLPDPGPGEVLLAVRACGLCHTDIGFLYGGVRPNAALPLTLGHEIVGDAVAAGSGAEDLVGSTVIVPAVLPCGECELCARRLGNACRRQKMPGNDFHGGFASHFLSPGRFLCPIPPSVQDVEELAVVADAVATSFQAVERAGVAEGDLAIVVGAGGVGTFAAQIARTRSARVAAIDVDRRRLEALEGYLDLALDASQMETRDLRQAIVAYERQAGLPPWGRKIFECSGTAAGQETAWALLGHAATLMVVGFTREKLSLRLSNLMAFDARAIGNWGCAPEHFPSILELIDEGRIQIRPFVEKHPMSSLNDLLLEHPARRPVLIPDFSEAPC